MQLPVYQYELYLYYITVLLYLLCNFTFRANSIQIADFRESNYGLTSVLKYRYVRAFLPISDEIVIFLASDRFLVKL